MLQQDAVDVDIADAAVDMIVSNLGVNNFEHADAVLAMCRRVLKPGGQLILTTNLVGHMTEFYDVYRATLTELGMTDRLPVLDDHIRHRATIEGVTEQLERAGFTATRSITDTFRMRFADGSSLLRHHFIRLGFLPGWKAVAPPDAVNATFVALERNLNAAAVVHGELALNVPMACVETRG